MAKLFSPSRSLTPFGRFCLTVGLATTLVSGSAIAQAAAPSQAAKQSSNLDDIRFTCEYADSEYTVMYHPQSQPERSYAWATPTELGGGWTSQRRCEEISRRLEAYRPDGLREMQTGVENGYNIVCVTTSQVPGCRIVLTVPPGQDPVAVRDRVFENLTVADSGQNTDAVNTFTGDSGNSGDILNQVGEALNIDLPRLGGQRRRSNGINLRPFLDRADGGTGTQLRGSGAASPNSNYRLNP